MIKNFFFTEYMANDDFSEPPRRADSKMFIFISLPNSGSGSPPGPGVSLGRILRGASIEPLFLGGGLARGLYRLPPPPLECPFLMTLGLTTVE